MACLTGNSCVDTFLDLQIFYDSIDNVRLIQQVCQLKRDSVVLYMSLLVDLSLHVLRIVDLWERMDSAVQFRSPGLWLLQFLGQGSVVQLAARPSSFTVQIGQQVDDINHHSHGTFFQALHFSVEATCMLEKGLAALGLTLSQNKSTAVASHPRITLRCAAQASGARNVEAERSVRIHRKREQKCRKRGVHIKTIQNGLKQKHET